jgi:hypothetical protein
METADVNTNFRGAKGISVPSLENLAEGFREVVKSLENGTMGKEIAVTLENTQPVEFVDTLEAAATSIQSFISSIKDAGASEVNDGEVLKLGKLSDDAVRVVGSLEDVPHIN